MKKSIIEKFVDFKKRHSLSNDVIVKMITEYANSDLDFARTHFSVKYDITEYTFYKARDFAVICCLVDNNIYKRLRDKAAANCSRNNPEKSARKSLAHFEKLYTERQEFLNSFTNNEIKDIAYKYAEGETSEIIAMVYDTGKSAIRWLIKKGGALLIVDGQTTEIISDRFGDRLEKALQIRERNKQILLECNEKEIAFLQMQIDCYDLYSRVVIKRPTIEMLQADLENAKKEREEVLRF